MTHRIFTFVCLLLVLFHFQKTFAQDELNLDESFNTPPPITTDNPGVIPPDTSELSLDNPMDASMDPALNGTSSTTTDSANPLDSIVESPENAVTPENNTQMAMQTVTDPNDQAANVNLASPEEILKRENALYGFSVGAIVSSSSMHENYGIKSNYNIPSVDRESQAIQSAGVMLRYAIAPFYSLGADINMSYAKSQNHKSVTINNTETLSEVNTLKGELNLTYAINIGGTLPIYFLAGAGAEQVTGGSIEKIIQREGYGGQIGGGFTVASTVNLEMVYSYYVHRVSTRVQQDRANAVPSGELDMEQARTENRGLVLRGTVNF